MKTIQDIDTPALLIDLPQVKKNIKDMQEKADQAGVFLRPHTKTHRTPALARLQLEAGAHGITVAKIGEAEVMAQNGTDDIFVASVTMGKQKIERLKRLAVHTKVSIGVDAEEQVMELSAIFAGERKPIDVLIEIETGEERTGLVPGQQLIRLAHVIKKSTGVRLKGVFSHEGHTYGASTADECRVFFKKSQEDTLRAAEMIRNEKIPVDVISIGATPSLLLGDILPGITEIRPGTYILMDAAQGHAIQDYSRCAATVLATVTSKPTSDRVVVDAGVKALTSFVRTKGICITPGYGLVKGFGDLRLARLYDEHGIILDSGANGRLKFGDKIQVVPNHICPTCSLYDTMYIMDGENVIAEYPVLCRGKSQ
jgi:D-serine deaminase-like pyridoxal phosphate-dependent protein